MGDIAQEERPIRQRMARALAWRHFRRAHMADADAMPDFAQLADAYAERSWGGFMDDAVAVLDAMREPDDAVLTAMRDTVPVEGFEWDHVEEEAVPHWHAMIDACRNGR